MAVTTYVWLTYLYTWGEHFFECGGVHHGKLQKENKIRKRTYVLGKIESVPGIFCVRRSQIVRKKHVQKVSAIAFEYWYNVFHFDPDFMQLQSGEIQVYIKARLHWRFLRRF